MGGKHKDDDNKKELERLPEKVFVARNSLLTDLFENKHIQTIYHVFGAIMVGLFFNTIFYDYLKHQRLHFGFRLIIKGFGNLHVAIVLWIFLFLLVCSTYVCFNTWAKVRIKLQPKSPLLKFWDAWWLSVLVVYYVYSYYWVLLTPAKFVLPPCSACCIVTEYTRMLMKVHSFVRTNTSKSLKNLPVPPFSKFLYFFFAPTLIYRDEYPRTNRPIRWRYVLSSFIEVVLGVLFLSITTERCLIPVYEDFCLKKYFWTDIVITLFANAVAGMNFMLVVFYIVLHSWQNAFAEMLTFADRLYYTTRLLMKVHSFVRTNSPMVLNHVMDKKGQDQTATFSRFVYFLFAPTLIYRDEYPRTNTIRWKFILINASEIIMTILYLSFIIERFLIPSYEDFCLKKYHWTDIFLSFFANAFAGILFLLIMFYCILHATQNIFAELLRFADREFYSDWWTSTTLPRYYRTWNIIVHDWLFAYIYKDLVQIGKSSVFAKFMVFFISALVHEIMLSSILGIFCPVLFVQFISVGLIFFFIKGPKHGISNILMLYGIAQGTGILLSIYCIEFYARYNSPGINKSIWDFFTLRSLECDSLI